MDLCSARLEWSPLTFGADILVDVQSTLIIIVCCRLLCIDSVYQYQIVLEIKLVLVYFFQCCFAICVLNERWTGLPNVFEWGGKEV